MPRRRQRKPTLEASLKEMYYNYGSATALQNTPSTLLRHLRSIHPKAQLHHVTDFLSKQPSYTVHHRAPPRQYPHRRIHVANTRVRYDADLLELRDLKSWNSGYQYALIVIDTFSRYVWASALKNKEASVVAKAFSVLRDDDAMPPPLLLYTDAGKEFVGAPFQKVLASMKIKHRICTSDEFHCPFVERVIRTVKEKLFQAMTSSSTRRWVDLLPKIVSTYNLTRHSATKLSPSEAQQPGNYLHVMRQVVPMAPLSSSSSSIKPTYKYSKGDLVRILKSRSAFDKGYLPRFTWEIFRVRERATTNRPSDAYAVPAYILEDLNGDEIVHSVFYEPELVRVHAQQLKAAAPVREVLKQRGDDILVWFQGYPKASAVWLPRSRLV